ncbi:MAG: hypothetical protein GXO88_02205 [Chlorobi bacterium]|nr:hypothetical protein [Chlorobiota bacterium]
MRNLLLILLAIGILISPIACKKKNTQPKPDPDPIPDTTEIIISENTKVIDLETRNAISKIDTSNFTFTFNGSTDELSALKVGDILVDSGSEIVAYGYLRKVKKIDSSRGETIVETEPAGLTEAILQGSIDFNSGKLKISQVQRMELAKGVKLKTLKNTDFTVFDMDYDMEFGSGNDKVSVKGNTSLSMEVFFKFKWDYCILCAPPEVEVSLFESGIELDQTASINVVSEYGASISERIPLATFYFQPWTFAIGPVPVVFIPKVQLFVEVDGSVSAEFSTGASESFNGRLGAKYTSDDGWSTIADKTFIFDYYPPQLDLSASVKANVGPEVSLMLYGVAGPFTNVTACSQLDAERHTGTDNWDLDYKVGVKSEVGIRVDVFLFEDEWSNSFCLFEQSLMHLDNEPMETGVFFENPKDGDWLGLGTTVDLTARVTGATPSKLDFYVDGSLLGSLDSEPWILNWNTASSTYGDHILIVNDMIGGEIVASDTINISLLNAEWKVVDLSPLGQNNETINKDVFFSGSDEGWMVGGTEYGFGGYMLHTTDGGLNWETISPTGILAPNTLDNIIFINEGEVLATTITGQVITSMGWQEIKYPTLEGFELTFKNFEVNDIAISNIGKLVAVGNVLNENAYKIMYAKAVSGDYEPSEGPSIPYYYNDMPTKPKIYFRNAKGIVYNLKDQSNPIRQYIMLSDDGGMSWESMQLNASGITRDDDIYGAFFLDENKGWLVGRESQGFAVVLKTTDGGQSWEKINVEDVYNFGSIWMLSTEEGYATVNTINVGDIVKTKLYHTQDGGYSWSPVDIVHTRLPMKKVFFKGPYLGCTVGGGSDVFMFSVSK